jgi:hypothetical protein
MPFPIDEAQIAATEAELGIQFPRSFRMSMASDNGGTVVDPLWSHHWQLHPFRDRSSRKRLARTTNHIVAETAEARDWLGFPERAVSIAHNGSGDHLVFLQDPTTNVLQPAVFLWDHESGPSHNLVGDFSVLTKAR